MSNVTQTPTKDTNEAERGRRKQQSPTISSPTSWFRSASTSSIRKLRRNEPLGPSNLHIGHTPLKNLSPIRRPTSSSVERRPASVQPYSLTTSNSTASLSRMPGSNPIPPKPDLFKRNSESVVVDVLPSFEMYNTLHRHIPQGNVDADRHDFPPTYQEVESQSSSFIRQNNDLSLANRDSSPVSFDINQQRGVDNDPMDPRALNNLQPLRTEHHTIAALNSNQNSGSHVDLIDTNDIQDDLDDSKCVFVDKLYTLPKLSTPIDINIKITKQAPAFHRKPEEESILKEYTSGDIIHGYCTIENKSSQPLPFEMFYVTLEAYTSVIDKQKGKRTLKRFLRMVDLSASWSYSEIEVSSGIELKYGEIDYDNAIIGLNNNRILEPGKKYKKFFMFKLPKQLLDVTCKQEHYSHCLLPPSFGIDKYRNNCKYSVIKVNHVLGCGHLGTKGSPILTYDMVDDHLSINYTIDARIVGKDMKTQKLNIMKEREYNLRVIPFGFSSNLIGERKSMDQLNDLIKLIQERLDALKKVFDRLSKKEPILATDILGTDISGTIDPSVTVDSEDILSRKMEQLAVKNRMEGAVSLPGFTPAYNPMAPRRKEETVETEINYKLKSKSSNSLTKGLLSGFRGSSTNLQASTTSEKTEKSGLILVKAAIPRQGLSYWSPSLLRKTNKLENKTPDDMDNWLSLLENLPEEERHPLEHLDLTLNCLQSDNSAVHTPPGIQSVTTEFICITAKSDNSIPIRFTAEMLMSTERLQNMKATFKTFQGTIKDYEKRFNENIAELNELYNQSSVDEAYKELKFTDFITSQMNNDVESLCNLQVNSLVMNDVFKKQMDTLKSHSDSQSTSHGLQKTSSHSKLSKFTDQIIHQWEEVGPSQFRRNVTVNLQYNTELRETLVPSFESCLCCRFYCVRVTIKFDNHVGSVKLDIPVSVRKVEA
ncbi:ubiquitin-ubiquitin ligase BUL1 [Nakaseomyces bracarensis]|uniref:ubiquitin-ubiquitin ligase BUL1 n=1 Tax=Nakaseomyces bracarensis TaxID=273131 RepID=UPI003872A548